MSSNIYAKVAPLLKERKSNIDMDDLLNFMERYKKNNFIITSESIDKDTNEIEYIMTWVK